MKNHPRTTIVYICITALPIFLVAFLIYWNVRQTLIKNELANLETIADQKAIIINNYFDSLQGSLSLTMASLSIKTNLLIIARYVSTPNNAEYVRAIGQLNPPLRSLLAVNGIVNVYLTNASGTVIYSASLEHTAEIGGPLSDTDAFTGAKTGPYEGKLFINEEDGNIPVFFKSGPIYDLDNNFLGVIVFEVDASDLYQLVQNTSGLGATGETLIGKLEYATGTGNYALILNPLRNNPLAAFNLKIPIGGAIGKPIQLAVSGANGSGTSIDYDGSQVLAAWQYLPERGWGLVAKINLTEVLSPANSLGLFLVSLSLLMTALATIASFMLSRRPYDEFRLAVDNSAEQIMITDPDATILYANRATERLTGYSIDEILDKKAGTLWHLPMPVGYYQNLWKVIKTDKKTFIGDIQNRRKNGEIYDAELRISPVLDKKNNVIFFVGIERDISEEKRTTRAKDEFISLASHQLRTPPSIIGWYTETLQSGDLGPINEKQTEYLGEIYKANQRMIAVINSLLNISRIEMGTFAISTKEIDIKEIVHEAIKELSSRFNRKIELKEDYDSNLGVFKADPNIMQIIIDNLLSNSFKYSPPEDTKIEITVKIEGDSLVFGVKDNGIGISAKDHDRIFEKLFRADNAVVTNPDGTGLGLYMTKKIIVDGLGGKIWFESKENEGATFYMSLPASGMREKTGTTTLARVTTITS